MFRFDLGPLLQGQTRITKLKSAYNTLIIGPRGLQCETNLQEIMGWESFDVVKFDLGSLLQGQTRIAKLKSAYNLLIIVSTGGIHWILWFSILYATAAAARRDIFSINALRVKPPVRFTKFAGYLHWG